MAGEPNPRDAHAEIPASGAVFTFGRSRFANNAASHFFIRNDPVVEMSCGDEHTAVVCQNGRVFAFGSNSWGQLGLGHKNTATMPSCIKSLKPEKATHVACGKSHTIVSTMSGKVFTFGSNMDCQLGLGDTEERSIPAEVTGVSVGEDGVRMLAAGCQHSALLTEDGSVYMWGSNSDGQLGLGEAITVVDTPKRVDVPHKITYINCGYYHSALITEEGKLLMCGEGENGKLGISRENRSAFVPTAVNIDVPIRSVACGGNHTIAVTMDGEVYGFGSNLSGQLGLGREILSFSVPECIETLLGKHICAVACGEVHTAFLTVEGHMYVCGDGRHGKLCVEMGSSDEGAVHCTPQFVSRFSQCQVKQVACGGCHTMVRATLEADSAQIEADSEVNEDVTMRPQDEKSPTAVEGQGRVLPPLQNTPTLNGFPEKSPKSVEENNRTENTVREEKDGEGGKDKSEDPSSIPLELSNNESQPEKSTQNDPDPENDETLSHKTLNRGLKNPQHSSSNVVNGDHKDISNYENGSPNAQIGVENPDVNEDLFSKFNLRDASDLTNEMENEEDTFRELDEADTPETLREEEDNVEKQDDRRCSIDVTPTLTVTGTDGVDLNSEDTAVIEGSGRFTNIQNAIASLDKVEGRMAKFFSTFRRKKLLSEGNVSVNEAWAGTEKSISNEFMKNGRKTMQDQLRSGNSQVHRSKACIIL